MDQPNGGARERVAGQFGEGRSSRLRRLVDVSLTGAPERAIAVGRVVVILFALIAISAERGGAVATSAYILLGGYLAVAAIIACLPGRLLVGRRLRLGAHLADVAVAGALFAFASGATLAFVILSAFVLMTATLRWDWRGVAGTAAALSMLSFAAGYADFATGQGGAPEPVAQVASSMNGDAQESELGPPLTTGSLGGLDPSGIEAIVLRVSLVFLVGAMFALVGALRGRVAARAERVRLVRDIHDTVLQDLAAANLMLRSALALPPETARKTLAEVGALIADQQRRIRQIAKGGGTERATRAARVGDELATLAAALARQWRCAVSVDLHPADCIPAGLVAEVGLILREAVANAVQHGHATRIEAVAERTGDTLRLRLSDDGHARAGGAIRPASLSGRVADLGGRMTATRTDAGVMLILDLPIR